MANLDQTETAPQASAPAAVPVTITKKAVDMVQITKEQEGIDASSRRCSTTSC